MASSGVRNLCLTLVVLLSVTTVISLIHYTNPPLCPLQQQEWRTEVPQPQPSPGEPMVEKKVEVKTKLKIIGWHEDLVSPIKGAAISLEKLGYNVSSMNVGKKTPAELLERLRDQDVVLWWAWGRPSLAELIRLRRRMHSQTWALYNWDDPHTTHTDHAHMKERASVYDVAFTSGEASLPFYASMGVSKAVFLPPPADMNVFFPEEDQVKYNCDVNFVLTNLYSEYDPKPSAVNRTGLILALAQLSAKEGVQFHLYGPKRINIAEANYKGQIHYSKQRDLFSRCRITINTHVNDGFGHRYANERDVIVPASGGLLLVDGKTPSILEDNRDCLMMTSDEPAKIAQQVLRILRNYDTYKVVKQQGYKTVLAKYSSDAWAATVDTTLRAFLAERERDI